LISKDRKKRVRARFHTILRYLSVTPIWKEPYYKKLADGDGVGEVLVTVNNFQHRVFGFQGPGKSQFTFLLACYHKDNVYSPSNAIDTAMQRKKDVNGNRVKIVAYEFLG
jgi:hypothetical protein